MEVRKSRLESYTPEEKKRYLTRLRERIKSGYLQSEKVLDALTDKLSGSFEEELAKY
ncbi:MAG: hypothetical protein V1913_03230 [Fibrobacterota bacterium]